MKLRFDFISNSSSCSFIIRSKDDPITLVNKLESRGKNTSNLLPDDNFEDWTDVHKTVINHTALTLFNIDYLDENGYVNSILGPLVVNDFELSNYFDESGEVKKDLDVEKILYEFSTESEEFGFNYCKSGKITKQTIKFFKWILEQVDIYKNIYIGKRNVDIMNIYLKKISKVEEMLTDNVYAIYFSYEGNAAEHGMIYCDLDDECKYVSNIIDKSKTAIEYINSEY